mgnify:FL=1
MKKYLLGIFAVQFAIAFSAFTEKKDSTKNLTDYYWFKVATGQGSDNTLNNTQVTDYLGMGSSAPVADCLDNGSKNCVVGFSSDQVEEIDPINHIYELESGDQTVQSVGHTRNFE